MKEWREELIAAQRNAEGESDYQEALRQKQEDEQQQQEQEDGSERRDS